MNTIEQKDGRDTLWQERGDDNKERGSIIQSSQLQTKIMRDKDNWIQ
jgi:hypothetical protein